MMTSRLLESLGWDALSQDINRKLHPGVCFGSTTWRTRWNCSFQSADYLHQSRKHDSGLHLSVTEGPPLWRCTETSLNWNWIFEWQNVPNPQFKSLCTNAKPRHKHFLLALLEILCAEKNHRKVSCKTSTYLFGGLLKQHGGMSFFKASLSTAIVGSFRSGSVPRRHEASHLQLQLRLKVLLHLKSLQLCCVLLRVTLKFEKSVTTHSVCRTGPCPPPPQRDRPLCVSLSEYLTNEWSFNDLRGSFSWVANLQVYTVRLHLLEETKGRALYSHAQQRGREWLPMLGRIFK